MSSEEPTLYKGMLRDRTWSMSSLKLLENCPLQYYLKYLKKLRHMDESQDTTERDLGTTIHYLLELMQSGHTISEAYELTEAKYYNVVTEDNWPRIIGMLPSVRKFNMMMHLRDEDEPFDYIEPEMMLAIDKDFNPVDFFSPKAFFRGVIDYTGRRGSESLVVDYKKGGQGFLTKYHSPQLSSYLLMDYYCNGKFEFGQSYIYYVEACELSKGPRIDGKRIETHTRPWLENKIESAIKVVEDEGYFKYKRGNMCKYCDYADMCKSGKRGTAGELTKFEIESTEVL